MLLCACTNTHDAPIDTTDAPDTSTEPATESDTLSIPKGENDMYEITYTVDHAIDNFNWDESVSPENLKISMMIPNHIVNTENAENCECYSVFDKYTQSYGRGFEFRLAVKTEPGFEMDEDIFIKAFPWESDFFYTTDTEITEGTLDSGFEYLMYENHYEDGDFRTSIFIRLTDEYIINIDYADSAEYRERLFNILNSIVIS